jgi:hypothetical protein
MAKDDVIVDLISNLASGGNSDFQPSAGVEIMLRSFGSGSATGSAPEAVAELFAKLTDGSDTAKVIVEPSSDGASAGMTINNTNYLQIQSTDAATQDYSYSGFQSK